MKEYMEEEIEDMDWDELYEYDTDLYWQQQYKELVEKIRYTNACYNLDLKITNVEKWEDLKSGKVINIKTEKFDDFFRFRSYSELQIWALGLSFGYYIDKGGIWNVYNSSKKEV